MYSIIFNSFKNVFENYERFFISDAHSPQLVLSTAASSGENFGNLEAATLVLEHAFLSAAHGLFLPLPLS